uniref:Malonyl-CoA decarboxylase n=1 Tax=Parascaris univalens TaxID=6257 RepID=A0A915AXU7_PARUN
MVRMPFSHLPLSLPSYQSSSSASVTSSLKCLAEKEDSTKTALLANIHQLPAVYQHPICIGLFLALYI